VQDSDQSFPRLFGTNGVRGVYGKSLTYPLLVVLAKALASYYSFGRIVVGYDGRKSSPALTKVVRAALNSAGIDTTDAGLLTTPCLQFAAKYLGYRGGVMITASHNPPEYNGIKPSSSDGVEISRADELMVEKSYYGKSFPAPSRLGRDYRDHSIIARYTDSVISLVDSEKIVRRKFTVVMDTGNGAQAVVAPALANRLGCRVIVINGQVDGDFPARGSEPLPTNLDAMCETVRNCKADFGVAFDGDGDRSIFCDEKGSIVWGDKTGSLLVNFLLSTKHPTGQVVCPINTSIILRMVAEKAGGSVVYTKVGSVEVSREMMKLGAVMGLEENGGFMYGPLNQVRDGAMATALVLEMLSSGPETFSKLVSSLPLTYQFKGKFSCSSQLVVERAIKACGAHGSPKRIETVDGVKIWIDNETWIMVRPSGTEPLIRMYGESNDKSLLDSKVEEYRRIIELNLKSS
jgi:phosphomannomutase / phosphoglucomutase